MPRISLILPTPAGASALADQSRELVTGLEAEGFEVELIPVSVAGSPSGDSRKGRLAAVVDGLKRGTGEHLVIVDPRLGYEPADVCRVARELASGAAELVIGSRSYGPGMDPQPRKLGRLAQWLTGSTDPFSGLVGLTREALGGADGQIQGVGSQFALELLTKIGGVHADVAARSLRPAEVPRSRPGFDDLRHVKRLADHRFGNLSRLLQFCVVGASGMVVDLSCYALFQALFHPTWLSQRSVPGVGPLDLAAAAFLAVGIALTWNFSLNRRLTFSYARSGSIVKQYVTYAVSNALAVTVNLAIRLHLPQYVEYFNRHRLMAAVVGIVLATGISFSMSRWLVFRKKRGPAPANLGQASASSTLLEAPTPS